MVTNAVNSRYHQSKMDASERGRDCPLNSSSHTYAQATAASLTARATPVFCRSCNFFLDRPVASHLTRPIPRNDPRRPFKSPERRSGKTPCRPITKPALPSHWPRCRPPGARRLPAFAALAASRRGSAQKLPLHWTAKVSSSTAYVYTYYLASAVLNIKAPKSPTRSFIRAAAEHHLHRRPIFRLSQGILQDPITALHVRLRLQVCAE